MSKRTLLLADDSVTIQKVVNLTFADEGIEVITVGDGDAAIERISQSTPDVVLADVHMPGLNGYQICEIVRENPVTKHLPVVLLVGSFEPFDENEAARVGANAFLTKPFQSIRQLVSQVTDLINASPAATEETVTEFVPAGDLPDTTDIDSLYHQSFGAPTPEGEGESGPPRFVDAGMDDEMIETTFASEESEVESPAVEVVEEQEPDVSRGWETAYQVEPDAVSTHFDEPPSVEASPDVVEASPQFDEAPVVETGVHSAEMSPQFDQSPGVETNAAAAAAGSANEPEPYVDQFAATEQIPSIHTERTQSNFDLDEIELLELPPIGGNKTMEFTTNQGGKKEVVSLSPELMELLVQKVVDKLSDKN